MVGVHVALTLPTSASTVLRFIVTSCLTYPDLRSDHGDLAFMGFLRLFLRDLPADQLRLRMHGTIRL
jgi:hypothetical protein